MENEKTVRVTLKGAGLSYEKDVSESLAAQIIGLCLLQQDVGAGSSIPPSMPLQTPGRNSANESAAEYLNRHAPKRNPDKILTCAGFLQDIHGRDSFQSSEIKGLFRDAGEVLPANFVRDFRWTINTGWIAPDPKKKGNFYVTNTGRKVLAGGFPDNLVKQSRNKAVGRRKRSAAKGKDTGDE